MPISTDKRTRIGLDPVTVDWSRFEKNPHMNPKDIPIGSVAFYIRKRSNKYYVDYGIVYDHYSDCVVLQRVTSRDRRMVISEFFKEPIPFKDFPYHTEWRKLPKKWSWDTKLWQMDLSELSEEEKNFVIDLEKPETIIDAYNKGFLVNVRDVPYEHIESVIEKENGYKLVRESNEPSFIMDVQKPVDTVGVSSCQCFQTYNQAKAACDKAEEELYKQAAMSDLEWSVYLIDSDLDKWARLFSISDENKSRARAFLMQLKDLENVETRVEASGIQWRVFGKVRWNNVPIE